jgi:CheY-like chemotaxis protein
MGFKHALVVDDSRSARKVLERMLQRASIQTDAVETAEEALDYLQHNKPDVIFMDHMMPGMNGLEATRIIRNTPATAHIPTIMYTSKDDVDYMQQAKSHGANAVLPKPATTDSLDKIITQVLMRESLSPVLLPLATNAHTQENQTHKWEVALSQLQTDLQQDLEGLNADLKRHVESELLSHIDKAQTQNLHALNRLKNQLSAVNILRVLTPQLRKTSLLTAQDLLKEKLPLLNARFEQRFKSREQDLRNLQQQLQKQQRQIQLLQILLLGTSLISIAALFLRF